MTGKQTPDKKKICKAWNDGRGCPDPCASLAVHGCDVLTGGGKICGSKKHTRHNHTGPVEGYVTVRSRT